MQAASLHMGPVVAGYSVHPSHPAGEPASQAASGYVRPGASQSIPGVTTEGMAGRRDGWVAVFDVVGWMMRAFTSAEGIQSRS